MIVRTQKSGCLIQIKMLPSVIAVVQNEVLTSPSHNANLERGRGGGVGVGLGGGGGKYFFWLTHLTNSWISLIYRCCGVGIPYTVEAHFYSN